MTAPARAPGVPADYYRRIFEIEEEHWWHRGMRAVSRSLLGERLARPHQSLLDAGCGTGGFLRWALATRSFDRGCGVDLGAEAIEFARKRVPEAELRVAPLHAIPFEGGAFDLIAVNDVLQHVHEDAVDGSLAELRRVLRPEGALLVRTTGARRARRARADWRSYDANTLRLVLERGGFGCERVTYANVLPSLAAAARGHHPDAPTENRHGLPEPVSGARNAIGLLLLRSEARYLAGELRSLPYGHTLLAVATLAKGEGAMSSGR